MILDDKGNAKHQDSPSLSLSFVTTESHVRPLILSSSLVLPTCALFFPSLSHTPFTSHLSSSSTLFPSFPSTLLSFLIELWQNCFSARHYNSPFCRFANCVRFYIPPLLWFRFVYFRNCDNHHRSQHNSYHLSLARKQHCSEPANIPEVHVRRVNLYQLVR